MEAVLLYFGASAATAATASTVFSVISAASTVMSAVGQYQQGQQAAAGYEFQAAQSRLQGRAQAIKYEQQANGIMKRSLETQAMARARAAAGGIDPFSGSAQFIQTLSSQEAGEEIDLSRENAKLVALSGETQAQQQAGAARTSRSRGLLSGFTTVLQGAGQLGKVGGRWQYA